MTFSGRNCLPVHVLRTEFNLYVSLVIPFMCQDIGVLQQDVDQTQCVWEELTCILIVRLQKPVGYNAISFKHFSHLFVNSKSAVT
jgi:hypothetical protein